jgi:PKD repeat protein
VGTYDVALTVTNGFGSDTETKTDYITVNVVPLPDADFEAGATTIYVGDAVDFTDLSTNNPTSWEWTFEGAETATSTDQNPTGIVYNTAGTYDVSLTVTNGFGSDTETKTGYITVEEEPAGLAADFYADMTQIEEGDVVHFYDLSTGNPTTWVWEIEGGNPTISYQQNPVVIFNNPGIFDVKLTITDPYGNTDEMIKEDYIEVAEVVVNYPPGWDFTVTGSQHIIAVPVEANPRIFGEPIEPGDWVGVFYTDDNGELKCGGATAWIGGGENIAVIAYGNDPYNPDKNGFATGEEFTWRIYSMNEAGDYPATASYNEALAYTNTFHSLGMSGLTDLFAGVQFEVTVMQGWSGISSPVDPWDKDVEHIFGEFYDNIVLLNNFEGMYWPALGINTLGDWDNHSGYNIKVNSDITVVFKGDAEENLSFDIEPGWTLLPVPVPCDVNTEELFAGHENDLFLIREIGGFNAYWPGFNINTLEYLHPGEAYMLLAWNPFTFEFSPCDGSSKNATTVTANSLTLNPDWGTVKATNAVHTVAVTQTALNDLVTGDVIGVFDAEGECFGVAQFTGKPFSIAAFGDDNTTPEQDGFVTGENFRLMLYRPGKEEVFTLEAVYDNALPNAGSFANNGVSAITSLKAGATGINQAAGLNIMLYPNPSKGQFVITGIQSVKNIEVVTPEGERVFKAAHDGSSSTEIDLSGLAHGIYFIKLETNSGPVIKKLMIE